MSRVPEPAAAELPELRLRRGEDQRLRAGHLWVFSNEVDTTRTPLVAFEAGQHVALCNDRGQRLATAYVNPNTLIAARILARGEQEVDVEFLERRLRTALALRSRLYPASYYRWVFGESDGLPGLVLDRFGDLVVGQIATAGMERLKSTLEEAIRRALAPATLLWKNDSAARAMEGLPEYVELAWGTAPDAVEVIETQTDGRELRCITPLGQGQKTGWFFDQAFNRSVLTRFMPQRASVLDVCCYAGGWASVAALQDAAHIACVDSSAAALEAAALNIKRNRANDAAPEPVCHRGDAFDVLAQLGAEGQRFDVVVVDPPAFIKRRKDTPQGVAAYRKLNQLALRLLNDNGLLVSCSCSHHLTPEALQGAIQAAARQADRTVQILYQGGQSPDHPIHPAIPETRYLKAFFCRVTHGWG